MGDKNPTPHNGGSQLYKAVDHDLFLTHPAIDLCPWGALQVKLQVWHSEQESARKNVEAKKSEWAIYFFTEIGLQNK